MPNVPYPYEVNWHLVTENGSLIPISSLLNSSLLPSLTVLTYSEKYKHIRELSLLMSNFRVCRWVKIAPKMGHYRTRQGRQVGSVSNHLKGLTFYLNHLHLVFFHCICLLIGFQSITDTYNEKNVFLQSRLQQVIKEALGHIL